MYYQNLCIETFKWSYSLFIQQNLSFSSSIKDFLFSSCMVSNSRKFRNSLSLIHSFIQFSHSVMSNSLQPHGLQHTRPPCPSPTPRKNSNSCPSSWWCHPTISSSVVPFCCLQSFPASGSFPMSQFFASGGQSIGVSALASVFPMNIPDWFALGKSKGTEMQK